MTEIMVPNLRFCILDQNFETIVFLDHYEDIAWCERYNEPGEIEVRAFPLTEVMEAAKIDNYIWSSLSDRLMIIESTTFEYDAVNGVRFVIKGRTLESILERRVLLYKTVFENDMEDGIRQIIDWGFMNAVTESGRKVDNFTFKYSGDDRIRNKEINYEYEAGEELLTVIKEICQNADIGFKITVNDNKQFVFQLYAGDDRSYMQEANQWVVFSPKFNNLINDSITNDAQYEKNFFFVVGEEWTDSASRRHPSEWIRRGTATGLLRREMYEDANDINHESTKIDGTKVTLSDAQYTAQLNQRASDLEKEYAVKTDIESQVDPNLNYEFNKDYYMGDIVQLDNGYGYDERVRVTEFIISHNTSGFEMYPKFTNIVEE